MSLKNSTNFIFIYALVFLIFPVVARPEFIPSRQYFQTALREINAAKSSVDVFMYLFSPRPDQADSQPMQLVQALKRAKDRGVAVRVVLDQGPGAEGPSVKAADASNGLARDLLAAAGVPVFMDSPSETLHAKALVVDGKTVLVGSSNWTHAAFNQNVEINVLARSTEVARDLLQSFSGITLSSAPAATAVAVPWDFMISPKGLGHMVSRPVERAFDAYLYVLKNAPPGEPFSPDTDDLARALGITTDIDNARTQIIRALTTLDRDYGLIHLTSAYAPAPSLILLPPKGTEAVYVPRDYWDLGWDRRLDFAGKVFYLLGLHYAAISSERPRWTLAREELARRHHVSANFVSVGVVALRRACLLDVAYGELTQFGGPRKTNRYTLRTLYDPADRDRAFQVLLDKYGPEKWGRARRYAELVYDDADVAAVERLIRMEEEYGPAKLEEVAKRIGAKSPDNPRRTMGYFIEGIRLAPPSPPQ